MNGELAVVQRRVLRDLRRAVTVDAAFFAAADPQTLLFTATHAEGSLIAAGPRFFENELGGADVNHFAALAASADPVVTLERATRGAWATSARWREIMSPLGLGDELRVALRAGGATWGFLCLHRAGRTPFSAREIAAVRRCTARAGAELRGAVARVAARPSSEDAARGIVIIDRGRVVARTGEVPAIASGTIQLGAPLPWPLVALVRRLDAKAASATALFAAPTEFVEVCAARLATAANATGPIALTISSAKPRALSALRLAASGVTPSQRRVAELVLRGRSTKEIADALCIGEHTVQDHLKAVFARFGVSSRRELVYALCS